MLVGRDVAVQACERALRSACDGQGRLLLVGGEAGIGKTALARAIAERAAPRRLLVRWGASWEGQAALPLAVWIDCLRRPGGDGCADVATRLERGELDVSADDVGRGRSRVAAAVVDAIAGAAAERPQLLILEDLHWADQMSWEVLVAVAAHLPALPVLAVATFRDDEPAFDEALAAIGGGAERLTLLGLDDDAVALLLRDVLGRDPSPDETSTVSLETGGNPLYVTEVARLIAAGSATTVPSGARGLLARRLARLSPHCERVLATASVLGVSFDVATVAAIRDEATEEVARALDEAAAARVVVARGETPTRWSFAHALYRATCYAQLGAVDRAELHRRAFDVLSEDPSTRPGTLAAHARRGRFDATDVRPAQVGVAAARDALARLAWGEVVPLAEAAVELAPSGPAGDELRAEAWLAMGDASLRDGRSDAAAAAFDDAAALGEELGRPDLVASAALGFGIGLGSFEVRLSDTRQLGLLERAAQLLPADSPLRPLVLARLSVALSFAGADDRRLELADTAIDLARRAGDDVALAAAIAARCDAIAGPDHVDERLRAATQVVELGQRVRDHRLELLGRRLRVVALFERRDLVALEAEMVAFARGAERLGDPLYQWYSGIWHAMRAYADGRIDDALRLADEARAVGRSAGSDNVELLCITLHTFAAIDRRDPRAVDDAWAQFVAVDPDLASRVGAPVRSMADGRCGRLERARATLARAGSAALEQVPRDQEWLTTVCEFLAAAVTVDDPALVRDCYDRLLPYAGLGVFEGVAALDHGVVDRFLAMGAGHLGLRDATRTHVDAALAGVADTGRLVVTHTRADCARALATGDASDRRRAAALARAAIDAYTELGLTALADELAPVAGAAPALATDGRAAPRPAALVREGDTWVWRFDGESARIRHGKGVADLSVLLARPGREVHVRELEGLADAPRADAGAEVLDATAVARYRERLRDLEAELEEADRHADVGRAEVLAAERDALVAELSGAFGIGGRRRRLGSDPDERLRKAVSARVKATIERLDRFHPGLARHLRSSVRTGFWCAYEPEHPVAWEVVDRRS